MLFNQKIIYLIEVLLVIVPMLISVAYVTIGERKTMGSMQRRLGPNRVGAYGLLQPFADAIKLVLKENVLPSLSNYILFFLSPIITLNFSLLGYAVIPFTVGMSILDFNMDILYLLVVSSLSTYGILLAGWSANSKYAFLGSLRSTAQLISYELILSSALLLVLLLVGSLNLTCISELQRNIWIIFPLFPVFYIFFIGSVAETNRAPFDLAEAESELVSGFMTEHAAVIFVFFFLAEYASILLLCIFMCILFIGSYLFDISSLITNQIYSLFDIIPYYMYECYTYLYNCYIPIVTYIYQTYLYGVCLGFKACILIFMFILVRASNPRIRYDQLMSYSWTKLLPLLIGFIFVLPCLISGFDSYPSNFCLLSGMPYLISTNRSFSSSARVFIDDSDDLEDNNGKKRSLPDSDSDSDSENDENISKKQDKGKAPIRKQDEDKNEQQVTSDSEHTGNSNVTHETSEKGKQPVRQAEKHGASSTSDNTGGKVEKKSVSSTKTGEQGGEQETAASGVSDNSSEKSVESNSSAHIESLVNKLTGLLDKIRNAPLADHSQEGVEKFNKENELSEQQASKKKEALASLNKDSNVIGESSNPQNFFNTKNVGSLHSSQSIKNALDSEKDAKVLKSYLVEQQSKVIRSGAKAQSDLTRAYKSGDIDELSYKEQLQKISSTSFHRSMEIAKQFNKLPVAVEPKKEDSKSSDQSSNSSDQDISDNNKDVSNNDDSDDDNGDNGSSNLGSSGNMGGSASGGPSSVSPGNTGVSNSKSVHFEDPFLFISTLEDHFEDIKWFDLFTAILDYILS